MIKCLRMQLQREINTTPASVSDMLKKLEEKKLIKYEKYKGVKLSKKRKNSCDKYNKKT